MPTTVGDIAKLVSGQITGDESIVIKGPAGIDKANEGTISFLTNEKYLPHVYTTGASAIIVDKKLQLSSSVATTLIRVDNVQDAVTTLLQTFAAPKGRNGIHSSALIGEKCKLGNEIGVGAHTIVERDCTIGDRTEIHPQVYIGRSVQIGSDCMIYPGVKIFANTIIGERVIIHANAVIGDEGFGFQPDQDGVFQKIIHVGNVIIEDDVEIGNNTVIDRGTMGSTVIRKGVKLDNLIQVAHNAEIGEHTVIAAQTGVSGSTKIGKQCMIGGQVGFVGHIDIADRTQVQAQSGVAASITEENTRVYGTPAIPYFNYLRSFAIFKKLPLLHRWIEESREKSAE